MARAYGVRFLASVVMVVAPACGGDDETPVPEAAPPGPTLGAYEQVVPFASPPAGVVTQSANNNLDVVRHGDRVYLAFRTAPSHFASPKVEMYVVSSADEKSWELEAKFAMGTDLREPRLFSDGEHLRLYFAVLGMDSTKFEPQGMKVSEYQGPGDWSAPVDLYDPGFIPWRAKVAGGVPTLIGYVGGENIYEVDGEPIRIHLLEIDGPTSVSPRVGTNPVIHEGGGSETDYVIQADGSLVAIMRNEAGEGNGEFGSFVCKAPASDLAAWTCNADKKKYDSPLVFSHKDEVWLIGRRQLENDGNFDLDHDEKTMKDQAYDYLFEYSFSPKRCSLWRVDPETLTALFALDLPSRGDTCFASVVSLGEDDFAVYNYTNQLDDGTDEPDWIQGQGRPTVILRQTLHLP